MGVPVHGHKIGDGDARIDLGGPQAAVSELELDRREAGPMGHEVCRARMPPDVRGEVLPYAAGATVFFHHDLDHLRLERTVRCPADQPVASATGPARRANSPRRGGGAVAAVEFQRPCRGGFIFFRDPVTDATG